MLPVAATTFQQASAGQLLALFAAFLIPILLMAVFFHYLPDITRRDIFFAVTVEPLFRDRPESRQTVRRFRTAAWIHSLIGLAVALTAIAFGNPLISLAGIGWQLTGVTHAFLRARRKILPHSISPAVRAETLLAPRSSDGIIHVLLQIGPFAVLGASALYLETQWDRIPARFPVHWSIDGRPNGWSARSTGGVYGPLLIAFGICVMLEILSYAIMHWTRQIRAGGPEAKSEARFRNLQTAILTAVQYVIALAFGSVPFLALRANPNASPAIGPLLLVIFVPVAVLFVILIRTGQGGANLARGGSESDILDQNRPVGDGTPDRCWRAGMFYVNGNDPAILVEKRFGIGYTLNFGRPAAWVLMAVILALVMLPLLIGFVSTQPR